MSRVHRRAFLTALIIICMLAPYGAAASYTIRLDEKVGFAAAQAGLALGLMLIPRDQELYDGIREALGGEGILWKGISLAGEPAAALAAAGILALNGSEFGRDLTWALLMNGAATMALKVGIGMARPELGLGPVFIGPSLEGEYQAFPSGHTSSAFATATVVAEHYPAYGPWAYLAAGLVGLSRIMEEKHWPSNVVFGAGLGYLTARIALEMGTNWEEE